MDILNEPGDGVRSFCDSLSRSNLLWVIYSFPKVWGGWKLEFRVNHIEIGMELITFDRELDNSITKAPLVPVGILAEKCLLY